MTIDRAPSRMRLPIDDVLDDVVEAVRRSRALVLQAPPGAGKTTRVPARLLSAVEGEIVVLEPRRIAARMSATRVAFERGERVGETVGYEVRFERATSAKTRLRYVTEGLFTRQLVSDPKLARVSAVVLDEIHERHLQGDVALALVQRLRATTRPDLIVVAMSATLDAAPVAKLLDAPIITAEGRAFPVSIEHVESASDRPLEQQIAAALRRVTTEQASGDVLIFLPGGLEIRRAIDACAKLAEERSLLCLPLHGELAADAQDRALARADRRKVVFATNVAETSITIDGVTAVIDAGLARVAGFDPWTGRATLDVKPISRASATQRAGRAGRTAPGSALRLYTRGDHDARPMFETPEIFRVDLAETALQLRAMSVVDVGALPWLDPPSKASLDAAMTLLSRLGALADDGSLTEIGARMAALPLSPRLARMVVEGEERGVASTVAGLAAIVSEGRALRARGDGGSGRADDHPCDLRARLDALDEAMRDGRVDANRARAAGIDVGAALAIDRQRAQICRAIRAPSRPDVARTEAEDRAISLAILAGFPDRVATRKRATRDEGRVSTSRELLLTTGGTATLSLECGVRTAPWLVAVEARDRDGRAQVTSATAIEPDWLLEMFADEIVEEIDVAWNAAAERAEATERMTYGALVLDERSAGTSASSAIARELFARASAAGGIDGVLGVDEVARLRTRIDFVRENAPDLAEAAGLSSIDDAAIAGVLRAACEDRRSFADLRRASLLDDVRTAVGHASLAKLDRLAPEHVTLGNGRRVKVTYARGERPSIGSRLQDFFGSTSTPRLLENRVPVTLHLHAPNGRDVQVTSDLESFWSRAYATVRSELMRRYPRHSWPEDPRTASPPPLRR